MQDRSPSLTASKAKKPFLPPDFVRAMLAGHSALGLAFAALIYVVCLTGTLSVFLFEMQRWEQPDAPLVAVTPTPEAVGAAFRSGYAKAVAAGAAHDIFIAGPQRTPGRFQVHYDDHEAGIEGEWQANEAGQLVTPVAVPWSEFIARLHMQLHLPRSWGLYLVGLTGVALLSSLISGLLSHPRIFKDAFALRWGGSKRLQEADLHNRLGVWGLPFHVVVTVTGALLGLSSIIIGVLALVAYDGDRTKAFAVLFGQPPGADTTAADVPDIAAMIEKIKAREPEAEFAGAFVQHLGTKGQLTQVLMREPGRIQMSTAYRFSGDGSELERLDESDRGVGRWILGALQPLHFGWFAGLPVKLLYGILGLALTYVTHSGVAIWIARRRDKGRPVPGWERAWAAVVWSQPIAFGTTAMAALVAGEAMLLPTYLATLAGSCVLAWLARDSAGATRLLRLAAALVLLAAAALHASKWWGQAIDPMAWYVDIAIVICALVVALPALRGAAVRTAPQSA